MRHENNMPHCFVYSFKDWVKVMKKKQLSLIIKLTAVFCGLFGLSVQTGLFTGNFNFYQFHYYTTLTSILFVFYFCGALHSLRVHWKEKQQKTYLPLLKGALILCMLVTMALYSFSPVPTATTSVSNELLWRIANYMIQYTMPFIAILDYLIFDQKGVFSYWQPLQWLCIPHLYLAYVLIHVPFLGDMGHNSNYPYPFLDIDALGLTQVLVNVTFFSIVYYIAGQLICFVDKQLAKLDKQY